MYTLPWIEITLKTVFNGAAIQYKVVVLGVKGQVTHVLIYTTCDQGLGLIFSGRGSTNQWFEDKV